MNAALESRSMSYSIFMGLCKKKNVILNRKMLSELALNKPEVFNQLVDHITS